MSREQIKNKLKKIRNIYHLLKEKWKVILIPSLSCGIITFWSLGIIKPTYRAKLTYALVESGEKLGGLNSIASQFGIDILGGGSSGAFSGDNLMELMKSDYLLKQTLLSEVDSAGKKIVLINRYLDFNNDTRQFNLFKTKQSAFRRFEMDNVDGTKNSYVQDSLLSRVCESIFKTNLVVSKMDKKSAIVKIFFTSKDEWFAINFIKKLVANTSDFYTRTKTLQMSKNVKILEKKADSLKFVLARNLYSVARESDGNQYLVKGIGRVPQVKSQIDIQVLSVSYAEVVKNLELSKTLLVRDQPLIQIIDYPKSPVEKLRVSRLVGTVGLILLSIILCSTVVVFFAWWKKN